MDTASNKLGELHVHTPDTPDVRVKSVLGHESQVFPVRQVLQTGMQARQEEPDKYLPETHLLQTVDEVQTVQVEGQS